MSLNKYTDDQLKAELARREEESKRKLTPKELKDMDWGRLVKYIDDGVKYIAKNGCEPKDFENYIFEEAMVIIYGKDVWKTYNKLM